MARRTLHNRIKFQNFVWNHMVRCSFAEKTKLRVLISRSAIINPKSSLKFWYFKAQIGRRNLEIKCCETLGLLEDARTIVFMKTDQTPDERIKNEWSEEKSKMRIVLAEDALFNQKWVILDRYGFNFFWLRVRLREKVFRWKLKKNRKMSRIT